MAPTVKMFPSGGATTLTFIVDGAVTVVSFVMRSKAPWNIFVPLESTSFGVQFLADVSVAPTAHCRHIVSPTASSQKPASLHDDEHP